MQTFWLKLAAIAMIIAVALAGGGLARRLKRGRSGERFLSLGAAMAAGVFLGAGLIHLLPESSQGFSQLLPKMGYPLAALLAACGLVGLLGLEKVLMAGHDHGRAGAAEAMPEASSLALVVVLSLHSVLAGVSLGLEASLLASAAIFLAIIGHKGSAAFALAVSLQRTSLPAARIRSTMVLFSLTTPAGVALGMGFAHAFESGTAQVLEVIFDGLAAGTFLYIATLDIVVEEFTGAADRWSKLLLLAAGLGIMALMAIWL